MVVYNFKKLTPVPSADEFIDIVLLRTQRKTPTVVHPGYKISRIRSFYMRKVKFTQETLSERLGQIIGDFPRLDDIHPFYADLLNVLYDRDHYKLALGQINLSKKLVEALSRDYVRLIKYGDTLYRCKQLKRAALGRMMTILKRQKASLSYLEEVRKHLARLPSLDPNTRTLLLTGFPNVGKSSFMNKVTRANVEVEPYAFTTKSLYVGHMDYRYLRWQVVDTPGILDHPLEQRNTIEMQAVTALAHLQCCVLYFLDISEQCGYSLQAQMSLFENIKPLFANKQLIIVANKTDVQPYAELREEERKAIEALAEASNVELMLMSNVTEEGITQVKNSACDKLLQARVDARLAGKKVGEVMNRLTVAMPKPRDNRVREVSVPESVLAAKAAPLDPQMKPKTEKDLMWEGGGPGVYSCDYRKYYDLASDDWKFDSIPEIMDGKNVADFVDKDIDAKLEALEKEEEQLLAEQEAKDAMAADESDIDEEEKAIATELRDKRKVMKQQARLKANRSNPVMPRNHRGRTMGQVSEHLEGLGVETSGIEKRGTKRGRSLSRRASSEAAARAESRARSSSKGPQQEGVADEAQREKAVKMSKKQQKKILRTPMINESDRRTRPKLNKHLIAGKSGLGTSRSR
ncbi:unnamed protein product [Chrysoparadoxa australica]